MKINQIIKTRLRLLEHSKKDFKTIFEIIHHNKEFVFCEKTDGFRIKQTTYGECYNYSYKMGKFLSEKLDNNSEYVGLMMDNSLEFITTFYGILMNNKKPVFGVVENVEVNKDYTGIETSTAKVTVDNDTDAIITPEPGYSYNVNHFDDFKFK